MTVTLNRELVKARTQSADAYAVGLRNNLVKALGASKADQVYKVLVPSGYRPDAKPAAKANGKK